MKVLIDMNLSPRWCKQFSEHGIESQHWSTIGEPGASDHDLMRWAAANGYILFTHDLNFSALLAATEATEPSVLQIRTNDVLPEAIGGTVMNALDRHAGRLSRERLSSSSRIETGFESCHSGRVRSASTC